MILKTPQFLTNIKIDFQRWNYRRKYKSCNKVDLENQLKAIEKAEKLSKKRKCRLWVIRLMPGIYKIYSKGDLKGIIRRLKLNKLSKANNEINIYQLSEVIVHITK
jgi:hypothetical protein